MKDITWKHVAVVLGFFATVAALALTGHDTGAFIVVGLAVLAALGLVVAQGADTKATATAVHIQSNGNVSRMLDIVEKQGVMLAAAQPPTPPTDPPPDPPTA